MNKTETIRDFYEIKVNHIPDNLDKEMGHFNVFKLEDFLPRYAREIPYSRKDFFKISLIIGKNRANYADKTIEIEKQAILFANPHIPYNWEYLEEEQSGYFCVFTEAFFSQFGKIKDYPVFKPGGNPIFFLNDEDLVKVKGIFLRIMDEIRTDYLYKYDLIRALVIELIHTAQKMQPATVVQSNQNAHTRISSIFLELLERQFPIESLNQQVSFRAPVDYANQLSLHVNYLNRVIKETTGKTTSQVIGERIAQEAKTLLKHSDWNIAEIGYSLGFDEPPHFINFFKKYTQVSPKSFRSAQVV
jgi:AraC-like DNA-binding protein